MAAFTPQPIGRAASGSRTSHPLTAARLLALLIAIGCVAFAAKSVAYYTTAGPAQPAAADGAHGTSKADAKAQSGKTIRIADATDSWLQSLFNPSFWAKGRNETARARARPRRGAQPRERSERSYRVRATPQTHEVRSEGPRQQTVRLVDDGGTYRTMCVRLCDGYFWPISFSATKRDFARDSQLCERTCDSPAALHVYRNPGEEPEHMVDLKGQPYAMLGTAFRFRVRYDAACKCRPHPWETASRQRHQDYSRADQQQTTMALKP